MKYVDYKATIWGRIHFTDETDMKVLIKKLEEGTTPSELCDEPGFLHFEFIDETEDFLPVSKNEGGATIEVYEERFQDPIWNNSLLT
jgi:hypothetical protein